MKDYRFYAEMPESRKSKSASKANPFFPWTVNAIKAKVTKCDVVAVYLDETKNYTPFYGMGLVMECASVAIAGNPQSYCTTSVSQDYLRTRTTRIPEVLARKLSPELFRYLES